MNIRDYTIIPEKEEDTARLQDQINFLKGQILQGPYWRQNN